MDFGKAIQALKDGHTVARRGWNGKGMFLFLNKGSAESIPEKFVQGDVTEPRSFIEGINSDLFELGGEGTITRLPNLNMHSATGSTVTGWLASQTDILAEDWEIVTP